jgi:flagellar transcriptional activator FlhC
MAGKSVVNEANEIQLAIELVKLGARLQLLESETNLSRERLLKIYKELKGVSPPKGMPFSADWFMTWQPNIHSSLFMNIHRYLVEHAGVLGIDAIIKAYRLYLEQVGCVSPDDAVLSLTRAWTLVRFFEGKMLTLQNAQNAGGISLRIRWICITSIGAACAMCLLVLVKPKVKRGRVGDGCLIDIRRVLRCLIRSLLVLDSVQR